MKMKNDRVQPSGDDNDYALKLIRLLFSRNCAAGFTLEEHLQAIELTANDPTDKIIDFACVGWIGTMAYNRLSADQLQIALHLMTDSPTEACLLCKIFANAGLIKHVDIDKQLLAFDLDQAAKLMPLEPAETVAELISTFKSTMDFAETALSVACEKDPELRSKMDAVNVRLIEALCFKGRTQNDTICISH